MATATPDDAHPKHRINAPAKCANAARTIVSRFIGNRRARKYTIGVIAPKANQTTPAKIIPPQSVPRRARCELRYVVSELSRAGTRQAAKMKSQSRRSPASLVERETMGPSLRGHHETRNSLQPKVRGVQRTVQLSLLPLEVCSFGMRA